MKTGVVCTSQISWQVPAVMTSQGILPVSQSHRVSSNDGIPLPGGARKDHHYLPRNDERIAPKILIVEDESIVALDIQLNLIRMGYQVTGMVFFGEEVADCCQQERPDLVLMDIRLSGQLDGIQVAELVQSRFGIPVIFLTGQSDELTLRRARSLNAAGYLLKPICWLDLQDAIRLALEPGTVQ